MVIVHQLGKSQSQRIVWLCEEPGLAAALKRHDRDPATILAPDAAGGRRRRHLL